MIDDAQPQPYPQRPEGMSDETVAALGKLSEALETVEYARGQLYEFHRRSGTADLMLQQARDELASAGHQELADRLDREIIGRDVVRDMWTFQIVDAYDQQYWSVLRGLERQIRQSLQADKHIFEAEMKTKEQGG
ncbi:MAG TPA: hypothetical protein VHO01_14150 [Jatrophihabitans sp.]|nr:hypothetical protein [Jatrophihabitans sp.]